MLARSTSSARATAPLGVGGHGEGWNIRQPVLVCQQVPRPLPVSGSESRAQPDSDSEAHAAGRRARGQPCPAVSCHRDSDSESTEMTVTGPTRQSKLHSAGVLEYIVPAGLRSLNRAAATTGPRLRPAAVPHYSVTDRD